MTALLLRTHRDSLEMIQSRHTPMLSDGVLVCSRDYHELWPCDSRICLDALGYPRPPFISPHVGHVVDDRGVE